MSSNFFTIDPMRDLTPEAQAEIAMAGIRRKAAGLTIEQAQAAVAATRAAVDRAHAESTLASFVLQEVERRERGV